MISPILIFAYNRPDSLSALLESLLLNPEAARSDLFIFVDAPKSESAVPANDRVREIARSAAGFRSVTCEVAASNKGLAKSIISGVTSVIGKYGRVIVLEDDLVLSRGFLRCMNAMLDAYEGDSRIMQVSGFSTRFKRPDDLGTDIYLNRRAESWSWGTWLDRWESIDWEVSDFADFASDSRLVREFNGIGSDLFRMLEGSLAGKNDSWAVKFAYAMFRQGRYTACPVRSLVRNNGFDSRATHSRGYDRYRTDFNESGVTDVPATLTYNRKADRRANVYWTLRWRIYGKIMKLIYG